MHLTIKKLLNFDSLSDARLLAGKERINQPVDDIMVMEHSDVSNWMVKHQVLLTSLYGFDEKNGANYRKLVDDITRQQGAGLIVKIGRHHSEMPSSLIEACKEHQLPLIQIDEDVPYRQIIFEATKYLFYEKRSELDYYYQTHHRFLELMNSNHVKLTDICQLLNELLERPVLLFNKGHLEYASDEAFETFHITKSQAVDLTRLFDFKEHTAYFPDLELDFPLFSAYVYQDGQNSYEIYIVDTLGNLDLKEIIAIENACHQLRVQAFNERNVEMIKHSVQLDLLDIVLFHTTNNEHEINEAITNLQLDRSHSYRLLVMDHNQYLNNDKVRTLFDDLLLPEFSRYMHKITSTKVIIILPMVGHEDQTSADLKLFLNKKINELDYRWVRQVYISEPVRVTEFPEAIQQIRQYQKLIAHTQKHFRFVIEEDVFVYKLIEAYGNPRGLKDILPQDLITLYREHADLYLTLAAYLEKSLNTKRTAEVLFVHPKTITYRLNRISELTNVDFESGESVLKYNMGIKVIDYLASEPDNIFEQ